MCSNRKSLHLHLMGYPYHVHDLLRGHTKIKKQNMDNIDSHVATNLLHESYN